LPHRPTHVLLLVPRMPSGDWLTRFGARTAQSRTKSKILLGVDSSITQMCLYARQQPESNMYHRMLLLTGAPLLAERGNSLMDVNLMKAFSMVVITQQLCCRSSQHGSTLAEHTCCCPWFSFRVHTKSTGPVRGLTWMSGQSIWITVAHSLAVRRAYMPDVRP
jgi:hypothetical protein